MNYPGEGYFLVEQNNERFQIGILNGKIVTRGDSSGFRFEDLEQPLTWEEFEAKGAIKTLEKRG